MIKLLMLAHFGIVQYMYPLNRSLEYRGLYHISWVTVA